MPCFSNALCAKAEISSSSTGRMRGSTSTTVTSTPMLQVEAGEFDADRAGADHQQRFRECRAAPSRPCRTRSACRRPPCPAAARARAPVARMMCGAFSVATACRPSSPPTSALPASLPAAVEHGDLVLAQQMRRRRRTVVSPPRATVSRLCRCRNRTSPASKPKSGSVVQQMVDLAGAQQRLGRDAAPVQAYAAQVSPAPPPRFSSQLRRADRGDIAAGTAAHDDQIEALVSHMSPALRPVRPARVR